MDKFKKLFDLQLLGWLLILLASFNLLSGDWAFDLGVVFVVLNLLCKKFDWDCPLCPKE